MKAKKNNKLILQISAVMIPIIIAMMGGILYIVYDSTVKGFLDAQNGMMTKKLTDMGSDTVWDIELSDWCFDYFNEHPEIIYDTEINVDDNEFSAYFDADNAWTVEWVESAPKELQEYAAKMYLANIRNSASWVTKDENYVSLFMFMTAAENEGRMLYEFNGPKSEGLLEKEEFFDLSVHGSVVDAIENGVYSDTTKQRLDELESQKKEIESQINDEQLSHPIIPQAQILFTLHNYRTIDTSTKEGKQRLIDGFVNSIYLYDDRFVITFNYKSQAKTVTFEEIESSPLTSKASPNLNKSEHFCSGLFFCALKPLEISEFSMSSSVIFSVPSL